GAAGRGREGGRRVEGGGSGGCMGRQREKGRGGGRGRWAEVLLGGESPRRSWRGCSTAARRIGRTVLVTHSRTRSARVAPVKPVPQSGTDAAWRCRLRAIPCEIPPPPLKPAPN